MHHNIMIFLFNIRKSFLEFEKKSEFENDFFFENKILTSKNYFFRKDFQMSKIIRKYLRICEIMFFFQSRFPHLKFEFLVFDSQPYYKYQTASKPAVNLFLE